MAAERDEKAGVESVWRCVFGRVCGWEVKLDGLSIIIFTLSIAEWEYAAAQQTRTHPAYSCYN